VDRLDRLLLGWVEVSDCHHLTNPTQPLLMLARYLHGTSRRPQLPGTCNKLVDGSQDVAASPQTATAGIPALACVIVAESMRDGVWDGQGWVLRYLEQVLERLAATEAEHWSCHGGTARDKCGSLSGLALYRFHHLPGGQVPIPRSDFLNKAASIGGKPRCAPRGLAEVRMIRHPSSPRPRIRAHDIDHIPYHRPANQTSSNSNPQTYCTFAIPPC
jgi:hypothetical protein